MDERLLLRVGSALLATLTTIGSPLLGPTVLASDLWAERDLNTFCEGLPSADRDTLQSVLKGYFATVQTREHIDLGRVKRATLKDVSPLLARAIELHWGPLELFSDAAFAPQESCALLFNSNTLSVIDGKFNIHGLWMIRAPVVGEQEQILPMEFMLLGQGKLIVGYPRSASVHVSDYDIHGGKFTYQPYMSMTIIRDGQSKGFRDIKTLDHPSGEFLPFLGPWDAQIHSLEVEDGAIKVHYQKVFRMNERVAKIPISIR